MNWQLSRQLCITASLMAVLISLTTAPLVVADENLVVPERTWQRIPGLERTAQARVFVSWFTGSARISKDDGATWNVGLLLDERSNVSYPDGVEDGNGLIWITYDRDYVIEEMPDAVRDLPFHRTSIEQTLVLLVLADGVVVRQRDPFAPVVITNPGPEFQDDARPGAMIIGMDRTPRGRICGCSSINYWVICRGGARVSMRC